MISYVVKTPLLVKKYLSKVLRTLTIVVHLINRLILLNK
jgi:hypothetical protein